MSKEGERLRTIGSNSSLDADDAKYIMQCAERLGESGHHTRSIYLTKMVENATIRQSHVEDELKIADLDTIKHIIDRRNESEASKWEMYSYDMFKHLMHWINTCIINQMKLKDDHDSFKFTIDYNLLYSISNHVPPYYKEQGLRILTEKILHAVGQSQDWTMKVISCDDLSSIFTISKATAEDKKPWWKFR